MIKYLGSKRRLVPVLGAVASAVGARTAVDLFSGTTRVGQELKRRGVHVTAVDSTRYAEVLARCYVGTDAATVDAAALAAEVARLDRLPGRPGYVTDVFCRTARFFQPHNGARIDAVRDVLERDWAGSPWHPLLLTSLLQAADRVDSTVATQMAFVKRWSTRSYRPLLLRPPALLAGAGRAVRGDACAWASRLGPVDLAYLDPPYNQHRYQACYHVWETLVAWDAPAHYGVACKRAELRDPTVRTALDSRRTYQAALAAIVADLEARLVVLSVNDESWLGLAEITALCEPRGQVAVVGFDAPRYVGARIGIHDPRGRRVGQVGRTRNTEYLVVCGEPDDVTRAVWAARQAGDSVVASSVVASSVVASSVVASSVGASPVVASTGDAGPMRSDG